MLKDDAPREEIKKVATDESCSRYGYAKPDFGCYQSFFNANIDFGCDFEKIPNYRRRLDLSTVFAFVTCRYQGLLKEYPGTFADRPLGESK
jgi:hypothetical protein